MKQWLAGMLCVMMMAPVYAETVPTKSAQQRLESLALSDKTNREASSLFSYVLSGACLVPVFFEPDMKTKSYLVAASLGFFGLGEVGKNHWKLPSEIEKELVDASIPSHKQKMAEMALKRLSDGAFQDRMVAFGSNLITGLIVYTLLQNQSPNTDYRPTLIVQGVFALGNLFVETPYEKEYKSFLEDEKNSRLK